MLSDLHFAVFDFPFGKLPLFPVRSTERDRFGSGDSAGIRFSGDGIFICEVGRRTDRFLTPFLIFSTFLISWRIFLLEEAGLAPLYKALAVAAVVAEFGIAFMYLPLRALSYGVLLFAVFYLTINFIIICSSGRSFHFAAMISMGKPSACSALGRNVAALRATRKVLVATARTEPGWKLRRRSPKRESAANARE